jgi:hypothetical protein
MGKIYRLLQYRGGGKTSSYYKLGKTQSPRNICIINDFTYKVQYPFVFVFLMWSET